MGEGDNSQDKEVVIGEVSKDKCPQCGVSYINILSIDGNDQRLKCLGINGTIQIKICLNCLPYDNQFCKYTLNGESEVLPFQGYCEDAINDEELDELVFKKVVLSKYKISTYYGCCDEGLTTIGEKGKWLNDCMQLDCPYCKNKMKYLTQLQGDSIGFYEGTMYFQICEECKIVGTTYKQS